MLKDIINWSLDSYTWATQSKIGDIVKQIAELGGELANNYVTSVENATEAATSCDLYQAILYGLKNCIK